MRENLSLAFPTGFDTNQVVLIKKMARGLIIRILELEGLYIYM